MKKRIAAAATVSIIAIRHLEPLEGETAATECSAAATSMVCPDVGLEGIADAAFASVWEVRSGGGAGSGSITPMKR
jgi:hypothetical protein